jgi:hypothetical protein
MTTQQKQFVIQINLEVGATLQPVTISVRTSDSIFRIAGGREQQIAGPEIPASFVPQAVDDDENDFQCPHGLLDADHDFQCPHGLLDADIGAMEGSIILYLMLFAGQQF